MKLVVAETATLREAMDGMRVPFIWMPDRTALSNGLKPKLEAEYTRTNKPFLLNAGATAGVFPGESHWLIPKSVNADWLSRNLKPLVAITDLIKSGESATIGANRFFHTGDIGDIIAALAVMKHLGGGELIIGFRPQGQRESMKGARFEVLRPLLEAQPYITKVEYQDVTSGITHDFSSFRQAGLQFGESLLRWQARNFGIDLSNPDPWLAASPSPKSADRVIIARSPRYHEAKFPWRKVIAHYGSRLLFVGLPVEHAAFQAEFNLPVEYAPTPNLMRMAELIAGASLFIGNQSSPFWIAAGLGAPLIQETWSGSPDSIVERPNTQYTRNQRELYSVLSVL